MVHLLLIGGGEIGAPKGDGTFRPLETLAIDEYFIKSLHKTNPHILFIPTATENLDVEKTYEQGIRSLYGGKLHCAVDTLYLLAKPSAAEMNGKLEIADAIYIGGGDTGFMLNIWQQSGFDKLLKQYALSGKPIAGLSAGAMCWFDRVVIKENDISKFTDGLGLIEGFCIPHWNKKKHFAKEPIAQNTQFIGIDECAALEFLDGEMKIIKSQPSANVYRCQCMPDLIEKRI